MELRLSVFIIISKIISVGTIAAQNHITIRLRISQPGNSQQHFKQQNMLNIALRKFPPNVYTALLGVTQNC